MTLRKYRFALFVNVKPIELSQIIHIVNQNCIYFFFRILKFYIIFVISTYWLEASLRAVYNTFLTFWQREEKDVHGRG